MRGEAGRLAGEDATVATPASVSIRSADRPRSARARTDDYPGGYLSLDIWQSAWGDFSEIDQLVAFVQRNHIKEICLNPGQAMNGDLYAAGYRQLKPIVTALRSGGVEVVRYLYAELNYDVIEYARFLKSYPDLGIDFLVDDSEFTDRFITDFDANRRAVQAEGVGYGGFVTVERRGNSGVSDSTRRWAIEHLDETILMSYLSCNLPDQREILEPYLSFADSIGRRGAVKIAILLGGKKVGRERSCEMELSAAQLQGFLRDLHGWAKTHPSYGGLVLESNYRLPRSDVSPTPLE